ncbi:MAG: heme-binding protein, partial [Dehalococcoidia bacterium]
MASTFQKAHITIEMARRMIEASEAKAAELGVPMVTAIVDGDGNLKALSRMDGAALLSVDIAQDKAYTAVGFGMATHEWYEFIKNDPPLLHGIVKTPRLIIFGGGYPIKQGDQVGGGIGV